MHLRLLHLSVLSAAFATAGLACGGGEGEFPGRTPLAEKWLVRANASYKAGDFDDAQSSATQALDVAKQDPEIRVLNGKLALSHLDYQRALKLTEGLQTSDAHAVRGRAHWYAGEIEEAADELERCVTLHGFKGAMIHGMSNGEFLDLKKFWPIYARAEKLDVPIYFHPSLPDPRVTEVYYQEYAKDFPLVMRPAWGFTVETATQAIRLVLSGVFEKHPKLKVVLGHFGETIPFLLWRIDSALKRPGQKPLSFRDIFSKNFYLTTSGFFSNPALLCCVMEMGVDHILFAVDWPFVADSRPAVDWMSGAPLSDEDKAKILSGNAKRLLKL